MRNWNDVATAGVYGNLSIMAPKSLRAWADAEKHDLTQHRITALDGNQAETQDGHRFINMVSCSYLGLDRHANVIEGARAALRDSGALLVPTSRARIGQRLIKDAEEHLRLLFGCETVVSLSCFTASAGVLPLLAAGMFTEGARPLMVFDKKCHFSMAAMRAACGNEAPTFTLAHHDIDRLESLCREHAQVAYIADGAHSLGGHVPLEPLLYLQEKYGLFLYLDDSHSLSVYGHNGEGYVRANISTMGPKTIIVVSLGKAFGAAGGAIVLGDPNMRPVIDYVGGPLGWSQTVTSPTLGAIVASARIHRSSELLELQSRLKGVMKRFDESVRSRNAGDPMPIRLIELPKVETALAVASNLFARGFYASAVFFPIVPQGSAGLRVMCRVDLGQDQIDDFSRALSDSLSNVGERT